MLVRRPCDRFKAMRQRTTHRRSSTGRRAERERTPYTSESNRAAADTMRKVAAHTRRGDYLPGGALHDLA